MSVLNQIWRQGWNKSNQRSWEQGIACMKGFEMFSSKPTWIVTDYSISIKHSGFYTYSLSINRSKILKTVQKPLFLWATLKIDRKPLKPLKNLRFYFDLQNPLFLRQIKNDDYANLVWIRAYPALALICFSFHKEYC